MQNETLNRERPDPALEEGFWLACLPALFVLIRIYGPGDLHNQVRHAAWDVIVITGSECDPKLMALIV